MGSYNYKAYIEPLHHLSWIFIGLFAVVTPFIMYGIVYVIASLMINGEEELVLKEFTLMKCAILTMSSLTLRGWDVTPSRLSSRAAFFMYIQSRTRVILQVPKTTQNIFSGPTFGNKSVGSSSLYHVPMVC